MIDQNLTTSQPDTANWEPLIITVAPNGARRTQADHPALPISPDELAKTAKDCLLAGAAMMHVHVRGDDDQHSLDVGRYKAAIQAIRDVVGDDLIIQVTTEAVGIYSVDQQMTMVEELKPEAVSMAVREFVPDAASETTAAEFFLMLDQQNIMAQYILYNAGEVARFADLRRRGIIPGDHVNVLYVLGRYAAHERSDPTDIIPFLNVAGHDQCRWGICAFGPREGAAAITATALGGHVRVGFENNRWRFDGTMADNNAELVGQAAMASIMMHRPLASADDARIMMRGD